MPALGAFELSATFISLPRFHAENHSFSLFVQGSPIGALAEYLVGEQKWAFASPAGSECQMQSNPSYTSCLKTGNFWFDSPRFQEVGCYSTTDFLHLMEQTSPNLQAVDLKYFREHGYCVRYKDDEYKKMLATAQP